MVRLGTVVRPGSTLVDYLPILRYVPGYSSAGLAWHRDELALFKGQLDIVQRQFDAHRAEPCFATHLLANPDEYGLSYDEMAYLCGSYFGAGSDTSAAAISVALMAAAVTPRAQERVQAELDRVVGRERSASASLRTALCCVVAHKAASVPTFADKADLPYSSAFVKEALRWRPISSGGFQHELIEDLTYVRARATGPAHR